MFPARSWCGRDICGPARHRRCRRHGLWTREHSLAQEYIPCSSTGRYERQPSSVPAPEQWRFPAVRRKGFRGSRPERRFLVVQAAGSLHGLLAKPMQTIVYCVNRCFEILLAVRLFDVAAEGLAHQREHLVGVFGIALAVETAEHGGRQNRHGNAHVDRGLHGPAAFA
ncbi:hypothetical protein D3C71_779690 [compost metagenome]